MKNLVKMTAEQQKAYNKAWDDYVAAYSNYKAWHNKVREQVKLLHKIRRGGV